MPKERVNGPQNQQDLTPKINHSRFDSWIGMVEEALALSPYNPTVIQAAFITIESIRTELNLSEAVVASQMSRLYTSASTLTEKVGRIAEADRYLARALEYKQHLLKVKTNSQRQDRPSGANSKGRRSA